jgi:TPR repeat protein
MPFEYRESAKSFACCGKIVCNGCIYSCFTSGNQKCPFCNANSKTSNEIVFELLKKRVEANDANSFNNLGLHYAGGTLGLRQDLNKALELWTRAAELGSCIAHCTIGGKYYQGVGVEKDAKKGIHHFELAAMAGNELARFQLGRIEYESGNMERAIKHWIISASAGHSKSILWIKKSFERGHVQSDVYELTLKVYNDSCTEMRSKAREDAAFFYENVLSHRL